jgi:hypothetical protein
VVVLVVVPVVDPDPPEELAVAQVGPLIVLASSVTVPADKAKILPFRTAPVFKALMPFWAIIVPINEVVVPRVTELPTRHQTLHGSPPVTDEPGDVISVDTDLKIQTPEPVKVRFPLRLKLLVEQYTPGPKGESKVKSCAPYV